MRKRKENIPLQDVKTKEEMPETEALETEREQRFEEISGETATEGVGVGFDEDSSLARDARSADGPLAGNSIEPPVRIGRGRRNKRKAVQDEIARGKGDHAAARSSKTI